MLRQRFFQFWTVAVLHGGRQGLETAQISLQRGSAGSLQLSIRWKQFAIISTHCDVGVEKRGLPPIHFPGDRRDVIPDSQPPQQFR